jgi:hypothetical protein
MAIWDCEDEKYDFPEEEIGRGEYRDPDIDDDEENRQDEWEEELE